VTCCETREVQKTENYTVMVPHTVQKKVQVQVCKYVEQTVEVPCESPCAPACGCASGCGCARPARLHLFRPRCDCGC
jgi:hypothetical protein